MSPSATAPRRRYRSELREQRANDTRRAVIVAAQQLFAKQGWAATGMREIADDAGCSVETVYSHFSSKRGVLRAVLDGSVAGDDSPVVLADRPEFQAMGKGSRPARLAAAAQVLRLVYSRSAAMTDLLRHAAASDDELEELQRTARELRRQDVATAFELLVGRAPDSVERDGLWAVASPEVYLMLVDGSGWSDEQYEAWMTHTLERIVPRT